VIVVGGPRPPVVRPGQVWADADPRSEGRTLRVVEVTEVRVLCEVVTQSTPGEYGRHPTDTRGRLTRIALARFRPTARGYRLVQDVAP
jgi:hypothetical protein